MVWLGAGSAGLVVLTGLILPIAAKLGARTALVEACRDSRPGRCAMFFHVSSGRLVRDALIAARRQQPVKNRRCVTSADRLGEPSLSHFGFDVVQKRNRARQR